MNTAELRMLFLSIAALVTTACSVLDPSGGGSSTANPTPVPTGAATVSGTVQSVNAQAHTLTVGTGAGTQLNLRTNERTVLTYDGSTVVEYQGQKSYTPQDLEIGDQIEARVERSVSRVLARNIKVISSVSASSGTSGAALTQWDATVRSVNSGNRSLVLVQSGREQYPLTVHYDANTRVEFAGRSYKPADVERNDRVQVSTRSVDSRLIADRIVVTHNANGSIGTTANRQLSGTIRNIDTSAHVIDLDSVAFEQFQAQGFDVNKNGSSTAVAYDTGTIVEYQGQRYGIENLESGDVVNIDASHTGNGYLARRIAVAQGR